MSEYTSLKIPKPLAKLIDEYLKKNSELSYRNRTEWVIELIRSKLLPTLTEVVS